MKTSRGVFSVLRHASLPVLLTFWELVNCWFHPRFMLDDVLGQFVVVMFSVASFSSTDMRIVTISIYIYIRNR
jgi:hypothetical protein